MSVQAQTAIKKGDSEESPKPNVLISYGFSVAGGGVGGVGLAWLAAVSTMIRGLL